MTSDATMVKDLLEAALDDYIVWYETGRPNSNYYGDVAKSFGVSAFTLVADNEGRHSITFNDGTHKLISIN